MTGVADTTDALTRLSAAKLWLVSTTSPTTCGDLPYLSTPLFALIPVASNAVTALTIDPSWRLYFNPTWVAKTDVPVIAARLAHLVWHLLADHSGRAADVQVTRADAEPWRTATDATIAELFTGTPMADGLADPAALKLPAGRSAEEYYARLARLPARPEASDDRPGQPCDPKNADPETDPDSGCGSGCDGLPRSYELPAGHEVGQIQTHDAEQIRRRVAIEFREHQSGRGAVPGQWGRWVEQILDPIVPWTQVLAAAVRRGVAWTNGHTDYTYSRISRRQSTAGRIILPATRRPLPEVAVVVDTSGSVDDGLLALALAEVDGVLRGLGIAGRSVTVLATDAAVHAVSVVRSARDVHLGGGGGTDLRTGITEALALKPRPGLIAVLTDGYTPWPDEPPATPIVAVLIGRARAELPDTPEWIQRVECVP
jgi:predicted metal-dependent peptidase